MKVYELVSKIGGQTKCTVRINEGGKVLAQYHTSYYRDFSTEELKKVYQFDRNIAFFNFVEMPESDRNKWTCPMALIIQVK